MVHIINHLNILLYRVSKPYKVKLNFCDSINQSISLFLSLIEIREIIRKKDSATNAKVISIEVDHVTTGDWTPNVSLTAIPCILNSLEWETCVYF